MKIEFEKVGRSGASWTAEHPNARTVEDLCCDEGWWLRQLRGKVMSEPDWYYDLDRGRVVILAGVRCVGFARVVGEAVPVTGRLVHSYGDVAARWGTVNKERR